MHVKKKDSDKFPTGRQFGHHKSIKVKVTQIKDLDDFNNFFKQPIPNTIELESPKLKE